MARARGRFRLRRKDDLRRAALRVLGLRLALMSKFEKALPGPEAVHDLRVETRRLRAGLEFFKKALDPERSGRSETELRRIGAALGKVRDLDVLLAGLDKDLRGFSRAERRALAPFRDRGAAAALRARRALKELLESPRYRRFKKELSSRLAGDAGRGRRASRPAAKAGRALIAGRLEALLEAGEAARAGGYGPGALHRLRISSKKLRYACEFFTDLCGRPAAELAGKAARLQDLLGACRDSALMLERVRRARGGGGARLRLLLACRRRARRRREAAVRAWERFRRGAALPDPR